MTLPRAFDSALTSLSAGSVHDRKYLLAVSGGRDSMCMADLFMHSSLHPAFGIANVNFTLRGEDSDKDQSLVVQWAADHGIRCHTVRFDTMAYARSHTISIEMAARELRYSWFDSLMTEYGYNLLSVAHNRNDSVETLFLNLLRGTGIHGISGIRRYNGRTIRPLLDITREEIDTYVSVHSVPYRDDATNFESDYARNKIRNLVFPVLKSINPSFMDTLASDMEHFGQAAGILDEVSGTLKARAVSTTANGTVTIDIKTLSGAPHQKYWFHDILKEYGFNPSQTSDIAAAINTKSGRKFFSGSHTLLVDRDVLKIYRTGDVSQMPVIIEGPGTYRFGAYTLTMETKPVADGFDPHPPAGTLYLNPDRMTFPLTCRTWHEGDRFRPFGMKGSRKLSDFFITLKLDIHDKMLQPVICDASDRVICIPPHRIDDSCRLTSGSRTVVSVSVSVSR